jgi:flagellar hook-associated protein 1
MTLLSSLSIASSGLTAIQGQIDVVSQNVSNANTAGYTQEQVAGIAVGTGDDLSGVKLGVVTRVTSTALQTSR